MVIFWRKYVIPLADDFARYLTNVIASVAFDIDDDCIQDPNSEFRRYEKITLK